MIGAHGMHADKHERPSARWSRAAGAAGVQRVLIVDDEETLAQYLQLWLERIPYIRASIATSGERALQLLAAETYDLLITDYCMPVMDGLSLAARVRDLYPSMVIVILTAHDSEELHRQAARLSIQGVLTKPVALPDLRIAVLKALLTTHGTAVPESGLSFLVVDANEDVAAILQGLLVHLFDCEVVTVANSDEALQQCAQRSFSLLVVNYEMPELAGATLARRVRALDPAIAVVLLTTSRDEDLRARTAGMPIHVLLRMPATLPELRQAVLRALTGTGDS